MQPDQPQQSPTPQSSMDYLNSITTQAPQKTMSPWFLWGLIGGVLVFIIVAVIFINSLAGQSAASLEDFTKRVAVLQEVSKEADKNIQSSELRGLNSNLTIILTNDKRDLQDALALKEIKADEKTLSEEVGAEAAALKTTLEDARLNAVFDRTYAREAAFYIKKLRLQMEELYGASNDDEFKNVLQEIDKNLAPLAESFSSFNAS